MFAIILRGHTVVLYYRNKYNSSCYINIKPVSKGMIKFIYRTFSSCRPPTLFIPIPKVNKIPRIGFGQSFSVEVAHSSIEYMYFFKDLNLIKCLCGTFLGDDIGSKRDHGSILFNNTTSSKFTLSFLNLFLYKSNSQIYKNYPNHHRGLLSRLEDFTYLTSLLLKD